MKWDIICGYIGEVGAVDLGSETDFEMDSSSTVTYIDFIIIMKLYDVIWKPSSKWGLLGGET